MAKDPSILPSFRDLAASLRVPAVTPEEAWRARQLGESLASLPGADDLRRLQEKVKRSKQEDEWRAQVRKQVSELRARIAHAQHQIEAWRKVKEKGEAELAALIPAPRTENRTADISSLSAPTASPSPVDPSRRPKAEPIDHAQRAVQALWPGGDPGRDKLLLKTATLDVNAWLADEPHLSGSPPPRPVSSDTVSRALARRK